MLCPTFLCKMIKVTFYTSIWNKQTLQWHLNPLCQLHSVGAVPIQVTQFECNREPWLMPATFRYCWSTPVKQVHVMQNIGFEDINLIYRWVLTLTKWQLLLKQLCILCCSIDLFNSGSGFNMEVFHMTIMFRFKLDQMYIEWPILPEEYPNAKSMNLKIWSSTHYFCIYSNSGLALLVVHQVWYFKKMNKTALKCYENGQTRLAIFHYNGVWILCVTGLDLIIWFQCFPLICANLWA